MTTLSTFMQTRATIQILEVVQKLRQSNVDLFIDEDDTIEYSKFTGVCYLLLNDMGISICCAEFGGDAYIEVYGEDNELDADELTVEEYLAIC